MRGDRSAYCRSLKLFGILLLTHAVACGGASSQPSHTSEAPEAPETPQMPAEQAKPSPIVKAAFGHVDGRDVDLYTLTNTKGLVLKVTTYGAIVTELHVPDRDGKMADIVHGFDRVEDY